MPVARHASFYNGKHPSPTARRSPVHSNCPVPLGGVAPWGESLITFWQYLQHLGRADYFFDNIYSKNETYAHQVQ